MFCLSFWSKKEIIYSFFQKNKLNAQNWRTITNFMLFVSRFQLLRELLFEYQYFKKDYSIGCLIDLFTNKSNFTRYFRFLLTCLLI
jgi:hypothetical protein